MQGPDYTVDQGKGFGLWPDPVSRALYHDTMTHPHTKKVLDNVQGRVGDFGGANGLLRDYISNPVTTIDADASKGPDIVDNILTHTGRYDTAWVRYVLHYLSDKEVIQFLDHVRAPRVLVMQFVNPDLRTKYENSRGEGVKYFRTLDQTRALLPVHWSTRISTVTVTAEFYKNRLGIDGARPHVEEVYLFDIRKGVRG